ncbi:MAG TPA: HAD-IA family hydrolase, partial [Pseudonocardia sp.]|nr:HAD-IA family hydrolase [Pseudonocardia sp.]
RSVLSGLALDRDLDAAVAHVLDGFSQLSVHPDVPDGVRALRAGDHRLVTLSNGSAQVAEQLLTRAGIRDEFERLLSVEEAGVWKPARAAYLHAAGACAVEPDEMLLVAVHPWDVDGAAHAGLRTAWLDRSGAPYPSYFTPPDLTVASLPELATRLAR